MRRDDLELSPVKTRLVESSTEAINAELGSFFPKDVFAYACSWIEDQEAASTKRPQPFLLVYVSHAVSDHPTLKIYRSPRPHSQPRETSAPQFLTLAWCEQRLRDLSGTLKLLKMSALSDLVGRGGTEALSRDIINLLVYPALTKLSTELSAQLGTECAIQVEPKEVLHSETNQHIAQIDYVFRSCKRRVIGIIEAKRCSDSKNFAGFIPEGIEKCITNYMPYCLESRRRSSKKGVPGMASYELFLHYTDNGKAVPYL